jgi:hypothetical protein
MAKKKHSKSESKQSNASSNQQDAKQVQHQQPVAPQMTEDLMATQGFPTNLAGFQSSAFPPGYQQPPNPLLMTQPQQQVMSQLDRAMVLQSYAGINPPSNPTINPMMDPASQPNLDAFDFNAFSANSSSPQNFWGDPSTAWFMPFNMDPPAIGEDNNLFSGNFDWNFGGFGDLGNGLPTGLTPGRDLEVEPGSGHDAVETSMGGLENL